MPIVKKQSFDLQGFQSFGELYEVVKKTYTRISILTHYYAIIRLCHEENFVIKRRICKGVQHIVKMYFHSANAFAVHAAPYHDHDDISLQYLKML